MINSSHNGNTLYYANSNNIQPMLYVSIHSHNKYTLRYDDKHILICQNWLSLRYSLDIKDDTYYYDSKRNVDDCPLPISVYGHSGGPLFIKEGRAKCPNWNTVDSSLANCTRDGKTIAYTRLSKCINWIKAQVGLE